MCLVWEEEKCLEVLLGNPEGKRPLGRPRHRWKNNIIIYVREVEWKDLDGIHMAQDMEK
jgi:hypothetical protein